MQTHLLTTLRSCAIAALVLVAFLNLWQFNQNISYLPHRSQDELVLWENRLRAVRDTLLKANYMRGDVGYIRASKLLRNETTPEDDKNWGQARYVMIPWNLLPHTLEAPYVVADFSGYGFPPNLPAGFSKLYESGDGLVVLQRTP